MRAPAESLGLPVLQPTGRQVNDQDWRTENGVILPAPIVNLMFQRFNEPILAPADLIPDSAYEMCGGRVLHLPSPREKVASDPTQGQCCDHCAFFRYEDGQAALRSRPSMRDGLELMGSRAGNSLDYGFCANDNCADANMLVHRFAGNECPWYRAAGEVFSSADPKKGRRLDWEQR